VTLVETGSYVAAAEAQFLSATTLHGHVKTLEEEVGADLVTFSGRRLELTRAGSRFLVFAQRALAEYDDLHGELAASARRPAGHLRIASLHGPSIYLLPPVVRAFQAARPEVTVSIEAKGVGESLAALVSGEVDLAVTNDLHADLATGLLDQSFLCEDELVLAVRRDCYAEPVRTLLERYPLAVQPPSSRYRQYVERWTRSQGIEPRMVYEHTSFDGILAYVLAGECVGMMASYVVERGPLRRKLRVLDLPGFSFKRQVIALHPARPDRLVAEFVQAFRLHYRAARGLDVRSDFSNEPSENSSLL
jgi:DNA-binding transcriptional LysR family regulator